MTKTTKRPSGIKGTRKLIRRSWCKCLSRGKPGRCNCKICTSFFENVRRYCVARGGWYTAKGERKATSVAAAVEACGACSGLCHSGGLYRLWPRGAEEAMCRLLCSAERVEALELNVVDKNDNVLPEVVPFKLSPPECYSGTCDMCGIDVLFKECNGGSKMPALMGQDKTQVDVFGCPVEMTDDPMVWEDWITITEATGNGDDDDDYAGGERKSVEWGEVRGTRAEFVVRVYQMFAAYRSHTVHVRTFRQCWKRAEQILFHRVALKLAASTFFVNVAMGGLDFTSSIDHMRPFSATCAWNERSSCCMLILAHSPYIQLVSDIPDIHKKQRNRLVRQGIIQRVNYEVIYVWAYR